MHILLLDTNDAVGGVVRVHSQLLHNFDPARFRVSVACQLDGPLHREFGERGPTQCIPVDFGTKGARQCSGARALVHNLTGAGRFLRAVLSLARYCRRQGVDLIYSSDKKRSVILAQAVAALSRRPFTYHIHNVYVDYRLNRRALRKAAALIANSTAMKEDFLAHLGDGMRRIRVVHNGLDPAEFRPLKGSTLREDLGVPPGPALVGVTTRLAPEKGHPTLLAAAADLLDRRPNSIHVVIVGDNKIYSNNRSYLDELRARIASLGIGESFSFAGYRSDMVNVYNGLDLVVDPAWEEAFGMVVIEPMACGRCVLGSAAGGIPEIIDHGKNGFLFASKNRTELARLLDHALGMSPDEREAIGRAARQTVLARFTVHQQTRAVEERLENALACPAARSPS